MITPELQKERGTGPYTLGNGKFADAVVAALGVSGAFQYSKRDALLKLCCDFRQAHWEAERYEKAMVDYENAKAIKLKKTNSSIMGFPVEAPVLPGVQKDRPEFEPFLAAVFLELFGHQVSPCELTFDSYIEEAHFKIRLALGYEYCLRYSKESEYSKANYFATLTKARRKHLWRARLLTPVIEWLHRLVIKLERIKHK